MQDWDMIMTIIKNIYIKKFFFFFLPNQSEEAISFEELSYQSRQPCDAGG